MEKRIVIMGASSGLGFEVAKYYIKAGWHVGVAARRIERLNLLKELNPTKVVCMEIDINQPEAVDKLNLLIATLGGMDVYLHSSGIGVKNTELNTSIEVAILETNGVGFVRCVDTAYHYFNKNNGGHLAVISSIAGARGIGASPAYSAIKRMQNTYIQALVQLSRAEKANITFTDIRPGFVDTEFLQNQKYPLTLRAEYVGRKIFAALQKKRRMVIIDWRYIIIVALWKLIPNFVWERMKVW